MKIIKYSKKGTFVIIGLLMLAVGSIGSFAPSLTPHGKVFAQEAPKCEPGRLGSREAPCIPPDSDIKAKTQPKVGNIIDDLVNPFIKLLTALIGVIIVISLIIAGIQYSSAGGDPSGVAAAKKRIGAAVVALIAYAFLLGFLQWLVPGGLV